MPATTNDPIIGKTFALDRHLRGWGLVVARSVDAHGLVWCWDEQQGCEYPVIRSHLRPPSAAEPKKLRR